MTLRIVYVSTLEPHVTEDDIAALVDNAAAFNKAHGITPKSIEKQVHDVLEISSKARPETVSEADTLKRIEILTEQMRLAAQELEFEQAARLRDEIAALKGEDVPEQKKIAPGMPGSRRKSRGRTRK